MIYKYKAISQKGEIIEGFFEGYKESDILAMLKGNNYLPIKIEKDIGKSAKIDLFSPKIKKKDLAIFCRQFYTMIDAGIGIVKSIDILEKQTENKTLVKALGILHEDVQKGFTLSEAMKTHLRVFPSLLINMVEAGEFSGNLDIIMERMALHYEKESKLENKIKSALNYPILLAFISIMVIIFLLVVVMPTFIGLFESNGQALPKSTQILLTISNNLTEFWYIFILGILGGLFGFITFKKTNSGKLLLDDIKLKTPIIKNMHIKIITSRFTRTLSILVSSGMPLLESIRMVGKVVGNKVVQDKLEIAVEDIRKGSTLSKSIRKMEVFPPMVDSMIKIGEESGSLGDILYKTADFYDEEVEIGLQKMTTLMEPLMIVFMALIVGFIVISMALPMIDIVNTI